MRTKSTSATVAAKQYKWHGSAAMRGLTEQSDDVAANIAVSTKNRRPQTRSRGANKLPCARAHRACLQKRIDKMA